MRKYKDFIVKLLLVFFLIGWFIGIMAWNLKQGAYVEQLEQELAETREQLTISNSILEQITMFNEREYYMNQEGADANEE